MNGGSENSEGNESEITHGGDVSLGASFGWFGVAANQFREPATLTVAPHGVKSPVGRVEGGAAVSAHSLGRESDEVHLWN